MKAIRHLFFLALVALFALSSCRSGGSGKNAPSSASDGVSEAAEAVPVAVSGDEAVSGVEESSVPSAPLAVQVSSGQEEEDSSEEEIVPGIKFLSKGDILPTSGSFDLLFSSVGYAKARVRVRKVLPGNILQFMQTDRYDRNYEMNRVATKICDTTITLGALEAQHLRTARVYALGLDEMVRPEPGAIYRVDILGCDPLADEDYYFSESAFGDWDTYDERHTDLLASNLALIAKQGDRSLDVFAFDILSGKPVQGARVKVYDFVQQELGKGVTDRDGRINFPAPGEARFVTASNANNWSYLDIKKEKALSTSNFDVAGTTHTDGIKGYVFGERGVWRPGDTIHVGAVVMFDGDPLPAGHPVVAELRNPDGQTVATSTVRYDGCNIFHFPFVTSQDARTGRWSAVVTVGSAVFTKSLRVETVKPNKLDIELLVDAPYISADASRKGTIAVKWLYGAPGSGLKVSTALDLVASGNSFKGYENYDFKDDARAFETQSFTYHDKVTDEKGECSISLSVGGGKSAPGLLKAGFTIRAYEPSGDFSTGYSEFNYSPYSAYVGMRTSMNKTSWDDDYLEKGAAHKFDVVTVDALGKSVNVSKLRAEVYLVDWSWWWNASREIANYMSGSSKELLFEKEFSTSGGAASFSYDWKDAPAGIYYVRVSDVEGGHSTSMICNVHENWDGSSGSETGATALSVTCDKEKYAPGQNASVSFPSVEGESALVTIEKGGKILETRVVSCSASKTRVSIPVNAAMMPNAYVSVTLIQPHGNALNDAPIRLYGVVNLPVEDESTHLQPVIVASEKVKPESEIKISVKEQAGRPMSYVVALVDEGLLGLTGFKTPDAWKSFYAKEALRVRTWDVYDDVIGAYGGRIEQLFAIGGDDEASGTLKRTKAERFTPVVAWLGPFNLKAGKTATHNVAIPQYIGSLRAMVVATDGKAQGSSSKNIEVSQPVMVSASVPRTVCVGEKIKIPVTLVAMEDKVGKVNVTLTTDKAFKITGPASMEVSCSKVGQEVYYFEVEAAGKTGIGHIGVTAKSSRDSSSQQIEIDVLHPNPEVIRSKTVLLEAGAKKDVEADIFGVEGSNSMQVEFSTVPPIDLRSRLGYLLSYPYGCIEQTVSCALPQLYLGNLMELDAASAKQAEVSVKAAIRRIQSFRRSDGSLSYWPGANGGATSVFGSAYALYFLFEARRAGYAVPDELVSSLTNYVSDMVKGKNTGEFVRAYGLYVLASGGKPQRGAMNNLRSSKRKSNNSTWLLAAAYALDGKKDVALNLTKNLPYTEPEAGLYYSYFGSELRNTAIAARVNILVGRNEEAFGQIRSIATALNDKSQWMSTQTTAWALQAMCEYAAAGGAASGVDASAVYDGKTFKAKSSRSLASVDVAPIGAKGAATVSLSNNTNAPVNAVVSVKGIPEMGEEKALSSGLEIDVKYVDADGRSVSVDALERGTTFKAVVTVTNKSRTAHRNIALAHRFPSGWEIRNQRVVSEDWTVPEGLDYQDFRDDRVYSFFSLAAAAKVTVSIDLTATYPGRFYLPAVNCAAMYDASVSASVPGRWIEVK